MPLNKETKLLSLIDQAYLNQTVLFLCFLSERLFLTVCHLGFKLCWVEPKQSFSPLSKLTEREILPGVVANVLRCEIEVSGFIFGPWPFGKVWNLLSVHLWFRRLFPWQYLLDRVKFFTWKWREDQTVFVTATLQSLFVRGLTIIRWFHVKTDLVRSRINISPALD